MSITRQSLLGATLLFVGGVMVFAMQQQAEMSDTTQIPTQTTQQIEQLQNNSEVTLTAVGGQNDQLTVQPLTTDIETETRILEQKQKEREAQVKAQEAQAQAFIKEQERAAKIALDKAEQETQEYAEVWARNHPTKESVQNTQNNPANEISKPTVSARESENSLTDSISNTIQETATQTSNEVNTVSVDTASTSSSVNTNSQSDEVDVSNVNNAADKELTHYAQRGDGLIKLSKRYNIPLDALAEANNMSSTDDLLYGQKVKIPAASDISKLQQQAKVNEAKRIAEAKAAADAKAKAEAERRAKIAAEAKAKAEAEEKRKAQQAEAKRQEQLRAQKSASARQQADQRLKQARQTVQQENSKGTFGVQVALAGNQENANEVVKKFKAAGYQVKTSQTTRGVRVIVGPERGKVAALALKDKINSDPRVKTTNAWVLYWR